MDQANLLFVFEVRRLAIELKEQAEAEFMINARGHTAQAQKAFESQHPFSEYIELAYRELTDVAQQVKALQDADRSAEIDAWINDK